MVAPLAGPRLTLVFGARGGLGRSVIAANVAVALVRRFKQATALWDLDWLAGGQLASALDLEAAGNWAEVLDGGRPVAQVLSAHSSGVRLLAAPPAGSSPPPAPRQVVRVVAELAKLAPQIVVDTSFPHLQHETIVALFDLASTVLVVITPDIPTLGATRVLLEQAQNQHYPPDRLQIVLNRAGVTDDLHAADLEEHLERPILASIPYHPSVAASVNRGVPIAASAGGGPVANAVAQLVQKLLGFPLVNVAQAGQSILARFPEAPQAPAVSPARSGETPGAPGSPLPAPAATGPQVTSLVPIAYAADGEKIAQIKQTVHKELVEELKRQNLTLERLLDPAAKKEIRQTVLKAVIALVDDLTDLPLTSREQRAKLVNDIADEAIGYGPLERFLADPQITEIMVNGPRQIYVERSGKLAAVPDRFTDETQLRVVIDRIVAPLGRRVDESSPMCDARLPDGSRVNVIVPPLALKGSTLTIRKFPLTRLKMDDLIGFGSLTPEMATFLRHCVMARLNVFISGGTGSGKTTLLNVLSQFIPGDERIVTIEDSAELQLSQDHVITLESRPPNLEGTGAVVIRDLVRNSLRMRPDRIVVGEVRGGEALDMLQAMNTGHDGSLCTGHANTPRDAIARLETMVLMAGMELPVRAIREQIASAINVVVQVSRLRDGSRKVTKITEISGMEGDVITMQDLFSYEQTGVDPEGRVLGAFRQANLRPQFAEAFERAGLKV